MAVAVNSLVMPDVRVIDRTLRAIRASLRPGGLFLGVVPAMDAIHYHTMLLMDQALDRGLDPEEAERYAAFHAEHHYYEFAFGRFQFQGLRQKFWQPFEIRHRLAKAGFASVELDQVLYPWDESIAGGADFADHPRSWDWSFRARPLTEPTHDAEPHRRRPRMAPETPRRAGTVDQGAEAPSSSTRRKARPPGRGGRSPSTSARPPPPRSRPARRPCSGPWASSSCSCSSPRCSPSPAPPPRQAAPACALKVEPHASGGRWRPPDPGLLDLAGPVARGLGRGDEDPVARELLEERRRACRSWSASTSTGLPAIHIDRSIAS